MFSVFMLSVINQSSMMLSNIMSSVNILMSLCKVSLIVSILNVVAPEVDSTKIVKPGVSDFSFHELPLPKMIS
jgi:hypothetical protein